MMTDIFKHFWIIIVSLIVAVVAVIYLIASSSYSSGYSDGYCEALGGKSFSGDKFCIIEDKIVEIE